MKQNNEPLKALTIGGSDSGGAAGIQADLKTWTALAVYGMSAITVVTAQNSTNVTAVHYLEPDFLSAQIDAVLADYGAHTVKTGLIGQIELIQVIKDRLTFHKAQNIIVDPVLVNHHGQFMFESGVIEAYRQKLIPLAKIITPNWREAQLLAEIPITEYLDRRGIPDLVSRLHAAGAKNILITGCTQENEMIDWYSDQKELHAFPTPMIRTRNRHGSGDTLSAAIGAYLAMAYDLPEAIKQAQAFTASALKNAASWSLGKGPGPLSHFP